MDSLDSIVHVIYIRTAHSTTYMNAYNILMPIADYIIYWHGLVHGCMWWKIIIIYYTVIMWQRPWYVVQQCMVSCDSGLVHGCGGRVLILLSSYDRYRHGLTIHINFYQWAINSTGKYSRLSEAIGLMARINTQTPYNLKWSYYLWTG